MAKTRQELTKEIELSLGGGMVDVELDPEHYDLAINKALQNTVNEVRDRQKNLLLQ